MPTGQWDADLEASVEVALEVGRPGFPPGCPAPAVCCGGVEPGSVGGGVLELPLPGLPLGGPPPPGGAPFVGLFP